MDGFQFQFRFLLLNRFPFKDKKPSQLSCLIHGMQQINGKFDLDYLSLFCTTINIYATPTYETINGKYLAMRGKNKVIPSSFMTWQ